jgi:hypothetical protein
MESMDVGEDDDGVVGVSVKEEKETVVGCCSWILSQLSVGSIVDCR